MCARYYPNGNNHKKDSPIGPGGDPITLDDNGISRWLYEGLEGKWTEDDQNRFERMYAVSGMRQYLDYLLDKRDRERLFTLYGVNYSDIRDPRGVKGAAANVALNSYALNFVSDNIKRLYRK